MRVELLATSLTESPLSVCHRKASVFAKALLDRIGGPGLESSRRAIGMTCPAPMSSHPSDPRQGESSTEDYLVITTSWIGPSVCNRFTTPINKVDIALDISGQSSSYNAKIRRDCRGSEL